MLQVLLNVFVHGQDVQTAIEQPRFASYSYPSSFAPYDYYPGRLNLEARYPGRGRRRPRPARPQDRALARLGPGSPARSARSCVDKKRGTLEAGADPRRAAYALGW